MLWPAGAGRVRCRQIWLGGLSATVGCVEGERDASAALAVGLAVVAVAVLARKWIAARVADRAGVVVGDRDPELVRWQVCGCPKRCPRLLICPFVAGHGPA